MRVFAVCVGEDILWVHDNGGCACLEVRAHRVLLSFARTSLFYSGVTKASQNMPKQGWGVGEGEGGRAHLFLACLGRLTVDHAFLSRRSSREGVGGYMGHVTRIEELHIFTKYNWMTNRGLSSGCNNNPGPLAWRQQPHQHKNTGPEKTWTRNQISWNPIGWTYKYMSQRAMGQTFHMGHLKPSGPNVPPLPHFEGLCCTGLEA